MIDAARLRYLFLTHLYGGIRPASERLDVSPSTVSRQIAQLETDLGLTLTERRGRNVVMNEVGLSLCEYYRQQQSAEVELQTQLERFRHSRRTRLRISMGEGFAHWLMEAPMRQFNAAYPHIDLEVMIHPTQEAVHALLENAADIAVTYFAPNDRSLVFHARSEVPICVVVQRDHDLTRLDRPPRLTDTTRYPHALLLPSFGGRQIIDMIARSEQITLRPSLIANSYGVACSFVALGQGVFLMPYKPSPQRELSNELTFLPLDYPAKITSHTQVITRRGKHLADHTRFLLKSIIDSGEFEPTDSPDNAQRHSALALDD